MLVLFFCFSDFLPFTLDQIQSLDLVKLWLALYKAHCCVWRTQTVSEHRGVPDWRGTVRCVVTFWRTAANATVSATLTHGSIFLSLALSLLSLFLSHAHR